MNVRKKVIKSVLERGEFGKFQNVPPQKLVVDPIVYIDNELS